MATVWMWSMDYRHIVVHVVANHRHRVLCRRCRRAMDHRVAQEYPHRQHHHPRPCDHQYRCFSHLPVSPRPNNKIRKRLFNFLFSAL